MRVLRYGLLVALAVWCSACQLEFELPLKLSRPATVTAVARLESVDLSWASVANADEYRVYYSTSELLSLENFENLSDGVMESTTETMLQVTGLTGNDVYYFIVTGVVDDRETKPTGRIDARPLAPGADGPMPQSDASWIVASGIGGSSFGEALSVSRDVNDDGVRDLAVGASTADSPLQSGRAFFYVGAAPLPSATPTGIAAGGAGFLRGRGLSLVDDLDGDGINDAVVGSPGAGVGDGQLDVYLGAAVGIDAQSSAFSDMGGAGARLGRAVVAAGDLDGDTAPDVLVGSPGYTNGENNEGAVLIYFGGDATTGIDGSRAPVVLESSSAGTQLAETLALAGDIDGNGFVDILAGAPLHDGPQINEGAIFLFLMDTGLSATPLVFENDVGGSQLSTLAGGADFNGDGYADFAAGAPGFARGAGESQGRVYVFYGSMTPTNAFADNIDGPGTNALFGAALAAGDINGDGFDDLVVGAPGLQTTPPQISLYLGGSSGLDTTAAFTTSAGQAAGTDFGAALEMADLNGDGRVDIVVGAPGLSDAVSDEGGVLLFPGPPREGPVADAGERLKAVVGDIVSPIAPDFTDDTVGTMACEWDWGDGTAPNVIGDCSTDNLDSVVHAYASPGEYTLKLRVSNAYGLYGTALVDVAIRPVGATTDIQTE